MEGLNETRNLIGFQTEGLNQILNLSSFKERRLNTDLAHQELHQSNPKRQHGLTADLGCQGCFLAAVQVMAGWPGQGHPLRGGYVLLAACSRSCGPLCASACHVAGRRSCRLSARGPCHQPAGAHAFLWLSWCMWRAFGIGSRRMNRRRSRNRLIRHPGSNQPGRAPSRSTWPRRLSLRRVGRQQVTSPARRRRAMLVIWDCSSTRAWKYQRLLSASRMMLLWCLWLLHLEELEGTCMEGNL